MPAQRVPGAKIDGPRYKWNGVYNRYLVGGISCAGSRCRGGTRAGRGGAGKGGRAGPGRGGAGAEEAKKRDAAVGAIRLFWFWFLGFSVLVYISLTGALAMRLRLEPRAAVWYRCGCCHLYTRNKSNNKIIMARGNASYLSLAIVYRRQLALFQIASSCPP